jgi:hypothetical protein
VKALTRDYEITRRMSQANVIVNVEDINDNSPTFTEKDYNISVLESDKSPKVILTVKAIDLDSANSETEIKRGYGMVRYSLTGENAKLFEVDHLTGSIKARTIYLSNYYFYSL